MKKLWVLAAAAVVASVGVFASLASADTLGPITFEPPAYTVGNINGQDGWTKTGAYDVAVVNASAFPLITTYGFGTQALRSSDAVTSGAFGDQTFSPGLSSPASETSNQHFTGTFSIGTALASAQAGLHMSVSPDDGNGARMSYLRFDDNGTGIDVYFDDVTDAGPVGTVATFNESKIATFVYGTAHTFTFDITLVSGPGNDVVKVYEDNVLKTTGTTWEDYYRFDPEQSPAHAVPSIDKMLFRESGTANPTNAGNGYLVDGVSLTSAPPVVTPATANDCKNGGWKNVTRADGSSFKNQGDCIQYVNTGK